MATPTVYVLCDQNCKYESLTKEQIIEAIYKAVNEGTIDELDTGFITQVLTINGETARFFIGEQWEYNSLSDAEKVNLIKCITDDNTIDRIESDLRTLERDFNNLRTGVGNGTISIGYAEKARVAEGVTEDATVPFALNAGNATYAMRANADVNNSRIDLTYKKWSEGRLNTTFSNFTISQALEDASYTGVKVGTIQGNASLKNAFAVIFTVQTNETTPAVYTFYSMLTGKVATNASNELYIQNIASNQNQPFAISNNLWFGRIEFRLTQKGANLYLSIIDACMHKVTIAGNTVTNDGNYELGGWTVTAFQVLYC